MNLSIPVSAAVQRLSLKAHLCCFSSDAEPDGGVHGEGTGHPRGDGVRKRVLHRHRCRRIVRPKTSSRITALSTSIQWICSMHTECYYGCSERTYIGQNDIHYETNLYFTAYQY